MDSLEVILLLHHRAVKPSMPSPSRKRAGNESLETDRQFVTALARGLQILACFDSGHMELGTAELAALTNLPQPTVWRLCYTLIKCGYLVQNTSNEKLRVGLGILRLGHSALWSVNRRELVLQQMQQLAHEAECAISLAVPKRNDMLIIERCTPQTMLILNLDVGSRLPIATTAMGWAYLAALTDDKRAPVIKTLRLPRNQHLREDIDAAVAQYRKCGYVSNASRFHPNINAIAVPIVTPGSDQVLAINCGGPASVVRMDRLEREIAPPLIALAAAAAQAISGSDAPRDKRRREGGRMRSNSAFLA